MGEANASGRKLDCECGYVAHGADDDELVAAVQAHAWTVHGMQLCAELVLARAEADGVMAHPGGAHGQPGEATATPAPKARR